jgi:nucleotide-binding universal stress UspA family protein
MWKDILVFADASEPGLARFKLAHALAQRFDAHLEGHAIATVLPRPHGPMTTTLARIYQELLGEARQRNQDALVAFKAIAPVGARGSVHHSECLFDEIDDKAASAARAQDLVVIGQPASGEAGAVDKEILMGAVFAGPPCLMVPRWIKPHAFGKRVMIAWKATPQAARAVTAALPLLQSAEAVRVVMVDAREEAGETDAALARLGARLLRHGVRVEETMAVRSDYSDRVGQAIDHEAEGFGADLLVMGAYGHARFAEFILGGVTRHIIQEARMPVLMTH